MRHAIACLGALGILASGSAATAHEDPPTPPGASRAEGGPFQKFAGEVDSCQECKEAGMCGRHADRFREIRERLRDAPPEVREKAREWFMQHREAIRDRMKNRFDANYDGELDGAERAAARKFIEERHPGLLDRCSERRDEREDRRDVREDRRDEREDGRDHREDRVDKREDRRDGRHDGGRRDKMEDRADEREDRRDRREGHRDGGDWDPFHCLRDEHRDGDRKGKDKTEDRREGHKDRGGRKK